MPTGATDDEVKPTDHAVTTVFLTHTHKTDISLKSSSLKAFLEISQIQKVSNPTKTFFMRSENGYAEAMIIMRSRIPLF
jgi:hypothetical protein